jgi:hypothetical protein
MKNKTVFFLAGLLTFSFLCAASPKFQTSWRNPKAKVIDFSGQKLASFVITAEESMRFGPEETLATELRNRGLDCVAGYTVLPGELAKDETKAKEFLKNAGITGAVLVKVLYEDQTINVPPSVYYSTGYYPSFWGYWNHGWTTVYSYSPGYSRTDKVLSVEMLLYAIEANDLVWAGKSETVNPKDGVREFVEKLIDEAGKEMRKSGLLEK